MESFQSFNYLFSFISHKSNDENILANCSLGITSQTLIFASVGGKKDFSLCESLFSQMWHNKILEVESFM